ncbi:pyrroline-5-carboxylate reductase family protein [Streptomyces sp. CRN 30]|uniref:pyrroline-5-carboxylate reductase family protein n=1 Tax=Streptomyces sp. CRN 30 TaxID=3075613 RepID=UPI002A7ED141|nr:pyrroline-5-carboxylate reductase dimerization domain-containing protein [Streptomyces sp. CRN 30]
MQRVVVIGAGHMGLAVARGVRRHLPRVRLEVVEAAAERAVAVGAELGLTVSGRYCPEPDDLILLAVPPQVFPGFAGKCAPGTYDKASAVVSLMAGVDLATVAMLLGTDRVVRAMPNAAAEVDAAMTVLCRGAGVTDAAVADAVRVLSAVGRVAEVADESLLDEATAVAGGGPAFTALFAQALTGFATEAGFTGDQARLMAAQVLLGTARLLTENGGRTPQEVWHSVMTPGGTTEQGVRSLREAGFEALVREALGRSAERARELGRGE